MLLDPAALLGRGFFEVDPDGFEPGQLFERLDLFLEQAAIGQGEYVEHGCAPGGECLRGAGLRGLGAVLAALSAGQPPNLSYQGQRSDGRGGG